MSLCFQSVSQLLSLFGEKVGLFLYLRIIYIVLIVNFFSLNLNFFQIL